LAIGGAGFGIWAIAGAAGDTGVCQLLSPDAGGSGAAVGIVANDGDSVTSDPEVVGSSLTGAVQVPGPESSGAGGSGTEGT
jgi:hypothetical protein